MPVRFQGHAGALWQNERGGLFWGFSVTPDFAVNWRDGYEYFVWLADESFR